MSWPPPTWRHENNNNNNYWFKTLNLRVVHCAITGNQYKEQSHVLIPSAWHIAAVEQRVVSFHTSLINQKSLSSWQWKSAKHEKIISHTGRGSQLRDTRYQRFHLGSLQGGEVEWYTSRDPLALETGSSTINTWWPDSLRASFSGVIISIATIGYIYVKVSSSLCSWFCISVKMTVWFNSWNKTGV